ncbi:helix-turn-helix domain-containing protein [Marinobacterium maritimum]|uniref:AraC family transcriptional regulator n=1 Tax=Marinobacterium maritimum TaxID=500162 RepID=UPI0031E49850
MKPLYADAGSGILFNLCGEVTMGDAALPEGVIMLPVKKMAEKIVMSPGARLAGIRFHPAIGYGVLGRHYDKPTLLLPADDQLYHLYKMFTELQLMTQDNTRQVEALSQWAHHNLDFTNVIPDCLETALESIEQGDSPGQLSESAPLSQRQIERHFRSWLGMTPKHYQRILRIKQAICFLRGHKNANLADVAYAFGFSDQAHMTREFRTIARITPRQV